MSLAASSADLGHARTEGAWSRDSQAPPILLGALEARGEEHMNTARGQGSGGCAFQELSVTPSGREAPRETQ